MSIIQIIALCATGLCVAAFIFHFIRIVRLGAPKDYSEKSGDVGKAVLYSNTAAMLPTQKESAYLHLPSFTLGILLHLATFLSILVYFFSFFPFFTRWLLTDQWIHYVAALFILTGAISGISLFIKRLINKTLRGLSNLDDYLSNGLTTLFQVMTLFYLLLPVNSTVNTLYYIAAIILLLYMPLGKLKHVLYYFSARYHLGFFYGWRNVWPPKK